MIPTPIADFVRGFSDSQPARFHMPGHKGRGELGVEQWDITEVNGADDLYHASGIIRESEAIASELFGCDTFYSTEGSSLCIRTMLYLACFCMDPTEGRPLVLAGRNAHKTLLFTAALLDLDIQWLYPENADSYQACNLTPGQLERALEGKKPAAVYVTSPDYLGNVLDIAGLAAVCHRHGVPLLVDNAHGAYLRFLSPSMHPIDLGADLCCDSAHKTLPVLTGGAYLHLAPALTQRLFRQVKPAMALFGSTSPSYLIMQSLDLANPRLECLNGRLAEIRNRLEQTGRRLSEAGFRLVGSEPLKLTMACRSYGYTGEALAALLEHRGIIPEFSDEDYLVFMLSADNTAEDIIRLEQALLSVPRLQPLPAEPYIPPRPMQAMSIREACFAPWEDRPAEECLGRISAVPAVSCPPAIPIVMCGERIDAQALALFRHYGITHCRVVCDT